MRASITKSIYIFIIAFTLVNTKSFAHFGSKGPFGGSVNLIYTYDTTVYLGTFNGGVFESTNSKVTAWRARPVGLKSGKITALAHTGKILFAGTADSGIFIFNGFVGSDRYWNKVNTGLTSLNITALVAINETTLMAATMGGGFYLTTNSGTSWTQVNGNMQSLNIHGLAIAGNRIFAASDAGVYYTENNGTSWISFNDIQTENSETTSLSYNSTTNELIIVNSKGIYKTSNASGATTASYTLTDAGLPSDAYIQSVSNNGVSWFIGTDKGVYTTAAASISWISMNTGLTSEDVTSIVPFKTNFICGTRDKGVFKSANPFTSWAVMNNGLNNLVTYSMVTGGELFVAAATNQGVFVSKDLAASYKASNKGLTDSLNVNDLAIASFGLYAATDNEGVFFSPDSGKTWSAINDGLTDLKIRKILIIAGDKYVLCASGSVYFSGSSSTSWTSIQTGLPTIVEPTDLSLAGSSLLLSTYGNGVYIKPTSGGQWIESNTGLTDLNVTSVTSLGDKIFAGTDGSGVFVSDAASVNWQSTSVTSISHTTLIGLDGTRIQAMASLDDGERKLVFASYKGGLLATTDNGATWIEGGNQFNLPSFTDVNKISFVATRVFVTTENNGLYSNALSELPKVTGLFDQQTSFKTIAVSPNPTTGTFRIDLSAITNKVSEISIYNNSGILMDTFTEAGNTMTVNYPEGMYLIHIKTSDNAVYSQKLIIE